MDWKSEWLREARRERKLRQEDLAKSCNVSVRTLQRAERGLKVADEHWLDFQEILGPLPQWEQPSGGETAVALLKRLTSGKTLIQELKRVKLGQLGCDIEPSKATIELLKECIRFLEKRLPHPYEFSGDRIYSPQSLADELDDIATLNEYVEKLSEIGAGLYYGISHQFVQYPFYHPYIEGETAFEDEHVRAVQLMLLSSVREREPWPEVSNWGVPESEIPF